MSSSDRIQAALEFMRDCGDRPGMFDEAEAALAELDRLEADRAAEDAALISGAAEGASFEAENAGYEKATEEVFDALQLIWLDYDFSGCYDLGELLSHTAGQLRSERESAEAALVTVTAERDAARAACNICGEPWPNHYEHCAYPANVRDKLAAEAALARANQALRQIGETVVLEHGRGNIVFEVSNQLAGIVECAVVAAAGSEEVSEPGSSAAVVDTDATPHDGDGPETVGERQGRQPGSLTPSVDHWCCGCAEHPAGKPWDWNNAAWELHWQTDHPAGLVPTEKEQPR